LHPDDTNNPSRTEIKEGLGQGLPRIIVACGGTGGHLFPGLAVAEELQILGGQVTALISTKAVDREAAKTAPHIPIETVEAVGFSRGQRLACAQGLFSTYFSLARIYRREPPHAVLAMGGFTSVAPVLAARRAGACSFLHESNAFPGRANRWLSRFIDQAFVGFAESESRLHSKKIVRTGTPVRTRFKPQQAGPCRQILGLDPAQQVVLVLGGSQGARGVNRAVIRSLPLLRAAFPRLQYLHLAGSTDFEEVQAAYTAAKVPGIVKPFFAEMEIALGAATLAVSRSGASTLAELAAMKLPSVLIPYPRATDDHQYLNARAYQDSGASCIISENEADPEKLAGVLTRILSDDAKREAMAAASAKWHHPTAAREIASFIMKAVEEKFSLRSSLAAPADLVAPGRVQSSRQASQGQSPTNQARLQEVGA
jgi:UDP-N-acetylglucosamine--N-acetylmuramyl-(pentapeptide) pyrophosphoryl-undecaprenol N-acetylglucosamine transferase